MNGESSMNKVPFKKINVDTYICGKSGCQYCKHEKKWYKKNIKPLVERNRIKSYELKLIKEQLDDE